ncbi:MAG: P-loop NTPase [bacterium]
MTNPYGQIKKVVGVMSGKGGVGKSSVTAMLASALAHRGYRTGILDADITGPSIPRLFGLKKRAGQGDAKLYPVETVQGIKVISINLLLEKEDSPVIWRGPLIAGVVKQFFTDVDWGNLDFLLVDLPPGTGDVPLTVMQSLPMDGMIIVSSPQELVGMIVKKAVHMTQALQVPVVGLIENMSYVECPDCHKRIEVFGRSKAERNCADTGLELLGRLPLAADIAALCDEGKVELIEHLQPDFFREITEVFLAKAVAKAKTQ